MRVIYEDENIALGVSEKNDSCNAVITFTSLFLPNQSVKKESWNSFSFGFNEKLISTLDLNAFYFVSKKNNWYESVSLDKAVEKLLKDSFFLSINKKVLHSTSMGAYGCIKVCNKLSADYMFIGSPQFSIDSIVAPAEERWKEITNNLTLMHNDAIENINIFSGRLLILVDPNHRLDMKQLELADINISDDVVFLPGAGHMPFQYLMKAGVLEICCKLAFSCEESAFKKIRDIINEHFNKALSISAIERALLLPSYTDTCRELSLIDTLTPKLRLLLIKKALSQRPDGPYIKKIYKELCDKFT